MTIADRWLLPDGIDEVLPPQANRIEFLRRRLLDLYHVWGYDQVMPPPVEFVDSLLTGTGTDLDLQTFKLTDQLTGRLMGASADVTPQVARMDAHSLRRPGPVRLCYCTNVLRAKADANQSGRSPVQAGVELFGHAGLEADAEIIDLALASLRLAGSKDIHLALGHVGIYRNLIQAANVSHDQAKGLFDALSLKSPGELQAAAKASIADAGLREMFTALGDLHGDASVFARAAEVFRDAPLPVRQALDELEALYRGVSERFAVSIYIDLAELRGYAYHTGMMFAAYVPGYGHALAKGGRYDDTGRVFGRARPATGFSMDLKHLANLASVTEPSSAVWAPAGDDPTLAHAIMELRKQGVRVVQALAGQDTQAQDHGCDRCLAYIDGRWQPTATPNETSA